MSAYIVSDKTISAIVNGLIKFNRKPPFRIAIYPQRVGQILVNENYRSVNFRYDEESTPHEFKYEEFDVDEKTFYGCLTCYNYQASETDDYYYSDAYHYIALGNRLLVEHFIGGVYPWGLD